MTEASRVQKLLIDQNAEIDRLKEEIHQLRKDLSEVDIGFSRFLPRQQAGLLTALCRREVATFDYLDHFTEESGYHNRYSGEMHQTLRTRVTMWKMRKTLRKYGIEINVLRGIGYSIDDENKQKLTELMKGMKK